MLERLSFTAKEASPAFRITEGGEVGRAHWSDFRVALPIPGSFTHSTISTRLVRSRFVLIVKRVTALFSNWGHDSVPRRNTTMITVILLFGLSVTWAAPPESPQLHRWTLDGGGVMFSVGGALELSATVAQTDAGLMSGGRLELSGGFWFVPVSGDCNIDGGVDLIDYSALPGCLLGPGESLPVNCSCQDLDHDRDVDLFDVAGFQRTFTGRGDQ